MGLALLASTSGVLYPRSKRSALPRAPAHFRLSHRLEGGMGTPPRKERLVRGKSQRLPFHPARFSIVPVTARADFLCGSFSHRYLANSPSLASSSLFPYLVPTSLLKIAFTGYQLFRVEVGQKSEDEEGCRCC